MSCTNGVHFIEILLWLLKRHAKILVLIINLFSLNLTSIETEGERVSSSQNERGRAGRRGEGLGVGGGGGIGKSPEITRSVNIDNKLNNS